MLYQNIFQNIILYTLKCIHVLFVSYVATMCDLVKLPGPSRLVPTYDGTLGIVWERVVLCDVMEV